MHLIRNAVTARARHIFELLALLSVLCATVSAAEWDNFADTWSATDGLGRALPDFETVGGPRADRTVAMFYFLWLGPHSQQGGPWDVTQILREDPDAMSEPASP